MIKDLSLNTEVERESIELSVLLSSSQRLHDLLIFVFI